jgi:hypothetical protein
MKLVALMPCRNESWVLGLSARAALRYCDDLIALDHASTDETPAILAEIAAEHPGRVAILTEPDGVWREMAHRQRLLDAARARGATHCAIVDADEVLTGNLLGCIRPQIEAVAYGRFLRTRMLAMWRGIDAYRDDRSVWSNRTDLALAFPVTPNLAWRMNGDYDHHHRTPYGVLPIGTLLPVPGGVMHLQFASWRRLVAKHALYKMTERIRWPEKSVAFIDHTYSQALDEANIATRAIQPDWWKPYRDLLPHLKLNHEPWQEAECRRLRAEHGAAYFNGLNLYGVANV